MVACGLEHRAGAEGLRLEWVYSWCFLNTRAGISRNKVLEREKGHEGWIQVELETENLKRLV